MKITGKTRLERRAKDIHRSQRHHVLTETERESTVDSLRSISALAAFAAEIIDSESAAMTTETECEIWIDLYAFADRILWTRCGKEKVRLTHAGMAMAHDLCHVGAFEGSRFPNLEELGFETR
jgi:hypothetical protein